jgi:hypothetical protein
MGTNPGGWPGLNDLEFVGMEPVRGCQGEVIRTADPKNLISVERGTVNPKTRVPNTATRHPPCDFDLGLKGK